MDSSITDDDDCLGPDPSDDLFYDDVDDNDDEFMEGEFEDELEDE